MALFSIKSELYWLWWTICSSMLIKYDEIIIHSSVNCLHLFSLINLLFAGICGNTWKYWTRLHGRIMPILVLCGPITKNLRIKFSPQTLLYDKLISLNFPQDFVEYFISLETFKFALNATIGKLCGKMYFKTPYRWPCHSSLSFSLVCLPLVHR